MGQIYLRRRERGLLTLGATLVLVYLIGWSLANFKTAQITLGNVTTSGLWLGLGLFWLWNVFDAYLLARGRPTFNKIGLLIPAIIVYFIGWHVTDINLDRLITRLPDTRVIFSALIHPDLFERDRVTYSGRTSFWFPCSNPPQPLPPPVEPHFVALDRSCGMVGDTVTIQGENFLPGAVGYLYWIIYDDEAQIREGGQPLEVVTGPDGRFTKTFKVPAFAGSEGMDPDNPFEQNVEVRFTQEVGPLHPSENFGDIVGKIVDNPPPDVLVQLGLFKKEDKIPTPIPGKLAETVAIGLMSTFFAILFAIPLSFFAAHNIMSRVPGGMIVYYAMRTFLNVVRSIDTLIWGLIVIVWVGLGSFAGVLALTIHSVAALGKLYSEEIEHIDPGPIEAITATGANLLQVIRYAVVPQIVPPFLAYTLLRWDINMRMATVVGFVAGGGIGFFVVETIRKGGYEQYAAALWAVAVVIIIVDYLSAKWRERILVGDSGATSGKPRPFYRSLTSLFSAVLVLGLFIASWHLSEIDLKKMLEPAPTFGKVVHDFLTIDLSPAVIDTVVKQMIITVLQALMATTLGGLVAIPFSFLAARNLMGGNPFATAVYYLTRGMFNVLRSIEAMLYVAIFVFWVGIGPFAGMLALAITTFALIGKLFSEAIENIDPGPLEAITATGATRLQTIVYAILPQIIPPFISYWIYQWDINIRIATVVGFAGGGGVGLLLNTYFGQLQYHKAGTVVAVIVVVIALMDLASAKIRERLV